MRRSIIGAAIAALSSAASRQAVRHAYEVEVLTEKLEVVIGAASGPEKLQAAMDEVERRRAHLAKRFISEPFAAWDPEITALESVIDDVRMGRWVP